MNERLLPGPAGSHPSAEELLAARLEPGAAASAAVLAHTALCASCAEEEARLDAFLEPEPLGAREAERAWERFRSGQSRGRPAPLFRRPALLALAAALALAAGLPALLLTSRRGEETVRSGGSEIRLVSPSGDLDAPPAAFVFEAKGRGPFRVVVFDATGYRWRSPESAGSRIPFPEAERVRLLAGAEYHWTVLDGRGEPMAQRFRVKPR